MHNGNAPQDKPSESFFKFSHPLIRGLIKGLSTDYDISVPVLPNVLLYYAKW